MNLKVQLPPDLICRLMIYHKFEDRQLTFDSSMMHESSRRRAKGSFSKFSVLESPSLVAGQNVIENAAVDEM
jgi:hypothetical protein